MLQLPLSVYLFNVSKKDSRQASMDILLMSLLLNRCFPTGLLVIHNWIFFPHCLPALQFPQLSTIYGAMA